ncbi:hypothetical protein SEA_MORGANA_93 [Gordonia phage Morgana]|uniref:Head-to-tail stopper n=1 Tax=Gordonia phage Morgana TaxID=3137292 RepID=A0AAX4RB47_9CAUD
MALPGRYMPARLTLDRAREMFRDDHRVDFTAIPSQVPVIARHVDRTWLVKPDVGVLTIGSTTEQLDVARFTTNSEHRYLVDEESIAHLLDARQGNARAELVYRTQPYTLTAYLHMPPEPSEAWEEL